MWVILGNINTTTWSWLKNTSLLDSQRTHKTPSWQQSSKHYLLHEILYLDDIVFLLNCFYHFVLTLSLFLKPLSILSITTFSKQCHLIQFIFLLLTQFSTQPSLLTSTLQYFPLLILLPPHSIISPPYPYLNGTQCYFPYKALLPVSSLTPYLMADTAKFI